MKREHTKHYEMKINMCRRKLITFYLHDRKEKILIVYRIFSTACCRDSGYYYAVLKDPGFAPAGT